MKKQKFLIIGMSCSACSSAVQRAMDKLSGINSAEVNLLTNSMIVEYNDSILSEEDIIATVIKTGYGASTEQTKKTAEHKEENLKRHAKRIKLRLILSLAFLLILMVVSMGHMVGINIFDHNNHLLKGFIELTLTLPIIALNYKYFTSGFKAIFRFNPNMDSLIAVGAGASVIYSIWQMSKGGSSHYYFESAGMILTFITIGKFLESKSKAKTTGAVRKLMDLSPKTSLVLRDGKEIEIDSKDILKGDIVIVKSGMHFPADGVVTDGNGAAEESAITGESMPVTKRIGDKVTGGTILTTGYLRFEAQKVGEETALAEIIRLVEDATVTKPKIAKVADKISRVFVPTVIAIAVITTLIWYFITGNFELSLNFGISVLVISCPCALGLATPTAIMVGTGKAAELGILVKSAEVFESGAKIKAVLFDKTGTITIGKPEVTDVYTDESDKNSIMKICSKIESMSDHPLAQAIAAYYTQNNDIVVYDFKTEIGKGVSAVVNNKTYKLGNESFATAENISDTFKDKANEYSSLGKTVIFVSENDNLVALIAVADKVKPTSKEAIDLLNAEEIETVMLTGDNEKTANCIKNEVDITKAYAELLPADKNRIIKDYQEKTPVAMVGDGINDSPALAAADVGIALGAGTDIAIESADLVLIKNDLRDVHTALSICRKVMKNIKENLFWALMYNSICIPIAAGALYCPLGLSLSPMIGTIAMSLSSVCVISNALRLRNIKREYNDEIRKEEKTMKTINIEGMACMHCKARVETILKAFDSNAVVDLEKATATLNTDADNDILKSVIEDAGYKVTAIN